VDVLFQSAAETYHRRVLGVVLTGMGNDGTEGAAWIKSQGGMILTESEASCMIYGMPRCVVEAGLSDGEVDLGTMVAEINNRL
jgi:two-component system chemotaxis response regulator CheB